MSIISYVNFRSGNEYFLTLFFVGFKSFTYNDGNYVNNGCCGIEQKLMSAFLIWDLEIGETRVTNLRTGQKKCQREKRIKFNKLKRTKCLYTIN